MIDHEDGGSDDDINEEEVIDNSDGEEDEDPLDVLNEEDREQLLENTVAVCTTLNKVCTVISCFFSIYLFSRFENYHLPLSIPQLLLFLHGGRPAPLTNFLFD